MCSCSAWADPEKTASVHKAPRGWGWGSPCSRLSPAGVQGGKSPWDVTSPTAGGHICHREPNVHDSLAQPTLFDENWEKGNKEQKNWIFNSKTSLTSSPLI